jgi:demethylmenaquinone methyltransferase/2-methoxy-6-polyprenyl-1,4-benzoquinol methylase
MTDELLREQMRYYRERAPEYDASSPQGGPFAEIAGAIVADLRRLRPVDRAIELGAGTGQFTGELASIARQVVAVDSSPEMLAINETRAPAPNIDRVVADVFDWTPRDRADLVLFAALFSHIPTARFDAFWSTIDRLLAPNGRAFVIDETPHELWGEEVTKDAEVVYRTLNDGRRFRIVKVLWDPDDLAARLEAAGWRATLVRRDPFYWGVVERRRS